MIDENLVKKLSKLAKISTSDQENAQYAIQIKEIMGYFEQISTIETSLVEPLVTPVPIEMNLRPDEATQECTVQEITQNAPARAGNLFKVPPVL